MNAVAEPVALDATDRRIVVATQAGLPLVPKPYHAVAERLGVPAEEVMARMRRMLAAGVIRRIGVVPNHYRIGYRANGMSVWNVPDERADELGAKIGAAPFVSHCYRRQRHLPEWPYNLFAMVHGRTRSEVEERVAQLSALIGPAARSSDILYSVRILKKTGLRIEDRGLRNHFNVQVET
ncbi:MAG: protein nirH [Betaproteobacteria bacterium RIFCSPLOWO2_12_FULL_62_58]|nr:MAG: protein nirH [Betaproteobacteria bacterium RIFCSPLOWO2_12_FULL_62_58]